MRRGLLLTLLVVVATASSAAETETGAPHVFVGPLPVRDMTAFGVLVLDMPPSQAWTPAERGWTYEVRLQQANNWLLGLNVREYLRTRPDPRAPLSAQDANALLALPQDVFYFDGEIGRVNLTADYSFDGRWGIYVTAPAHYYGGGFGDATIEEFHRSLGFGANERPLTARDSFAVVLDVRGEQLVMTEQPTSGGFTDPVVGGRWSLEEGDWRVVLEAALKVPLADEGKFLSTGSFDYGLQFLARRAVNRHGLYIGLGHVWAGEGDFLKAAADRSIPSFHVAWEIVASPRTSVVFQNNVRPSLYQHTSDTELNHDKFQTTGGIRHRRGGLIYSFGVTENYKSQENAPDIGVFFSVGWSGGREGR